MIVDTGAQAPKFLFIVRTPTDRSIVSPFYELGFKVKEPDGFDYDDNTAVLCFEYFVGNLKRIGNAERVFEIEDDKGNSELIVGREERPYHFVIGYMDMNPNYPDGRVRTKKETEFLANYFKTLRARNREYLQKTLPKEQLRKVGDPFLIVESRAYRGLEYGTAKPYSFAQLQGDWARKTHIVYDISTYAINGMQGSVTVAPSRDIKAIWGSVDRSVGPPILLACEFMFGNDKHDRLMRSHYQKVLTGQYGISAAIAYAIINGDAEDFLSTSEYEKAKDWLTKYSNLQGSDIESLLHTGIKYIRALSFPQAGPTLFIDYTGLTCWDEDKVEAMFPGKRELENEDCIKIIKDIAKEKLNLELGDARSIGFDNSISMFMMSLAVSPQQLIENLMRLRELSELIPETPPFVPGHWQEPPTSLFHKEEEPLREVVKGLTKSLEGFTRD